MLLTGQSLFYGNGVMEMGSVMEMHGNGVRSNFYIDRTGKTDFPLVSFKPRCLGGRFARHETV